MKVILILALLSLSVCTEMCNDVTEASSYDDCKDLGVETDSYCCFNEYNGKNNKGETFNFKYCNQLPKTDYDNLDETMTSIIKNMESQGDIIEKFNVICPDKTFIGKEEKTDTGKNDTTTPDSNNSGKNDTTTNNTNTDDESDSSNYLSKSLIILLSLLF